MGRDRERRRAKRPGTVGRVPEGLAQRVGPGITEAMNLAIEEHPDFPAAFLPTDLEMMVIQSLNNWIGAEVKR